MTRKAIVSVLCLLLFWTVVAIIGAVSVRIVLQPNHAVPTSLQEQEK